MLVVFMWLFFVIFVIVFVVVLSFVHISQDFWAFCTSQEID